MVITKKERKMINEHKPESCPPVTRDSVEEVWFHSGCPDGVGAASVAYIFAQREGKKFQFQGLCHHRETPSGEGKKIAIFDFCPKEDDLRRLITESDGMSVYDHHQGVEHIMKQFPSNCHFDNNHSGAYLAWMFFFPYLNPPKWILAIEDRDLWKFQYDYTKSLCLVLYNDAEGIFQNLIALLYPKGIRPLPKLGDKDGTAYENDFRNDNLPNYQKLIKTGSIYKRNSDAIAKAQSGLFIKAYFCGYKAGIGNISTLPSETCAFFLMKNTDFPLAIAWTFRPDGYYHISLRSVKTSGIDCSKIAARYNGNGHREAAGFRLQSITNILDFFKDQTK